MSAGPDEQDPLALARHHVAEGTAALARQEALVARLAGSANRALLARAEEVLATLRTSLRLMQQDLETLEKRHAARRDRARGQRGMKPGGGGV
jgi:hypothetical protein